jgi:tRNA modification GTPase
MALLHARSLYLEVRKMKSSSSRPPSDTIFALSSGPPPAAIAVIRVSGPAAQVALERLIGRVPEPRRAALAKVIDPTSGALLDEALALWFPGPRSETGEDLAEFQIHGGRAVIAAVLKALGELPGFRLAEPGEFTRRAFEAGRLDLTAVEGLADLVGAETEAQRSQALGQLRGLLGGRAEAWRKRLIDALALVEAGIDFSDEGDVPKELVPKAIGIVREVERDIAEALAGAGRGERLREGLWIAIAGPPNAGKSTLLNRLARRDAAIVSPQAGTTRDVIEVHFDLQGYPVNLLDTAGFNEASQDPIEREGMRRAHDVMGRADLVLWITDAREVGKDSMADLVLNPGASRWTVLNKIDLLEAPLQAAPARDQFPISAATGKGVEDLVAALVRFASEAFRFSEPALVTRERQRVRLSEVLGALRDAITKAEQGAGEAAVAEELVAEDLRHALTGLGRLTGRVDVEEVLDVIFREFCVGK